MYVKKSINLCRYRICESDLELIADSANWLESYREAISFHSVKKNLSQGLDRLLNKCMRTEFWGETQHNDHDRPNFMGNQHKALWERSRGRVR